MDSDLKEMLDGFREESNQLIAELKPFVENIDEFTPIESTYEFSQKIDRIMGSADTLFSLYDDISAFKKIGILARLGKELGTLVSKKAQPKHLPVFAGFCEDLLDTIEEYIQNIENEKKIGDITLRFFPILEKRIRWFQDKIQPSSQKETIDNSSINDLLAEFGM